MGRHSLLDSDESSITASTPSPSSQAARRPTLSDRSPTRSVRLVMAFERKRCYRRSAPTVARSGAFNVPPSAARFAPEEARWKKEAAGRRRPLEEGGPLEGGGRWKKEAAGSGTRRALMSRTVTLARPSG